MWNAVVIIRSTKYMNESWLTAMTPDFGGE